MLADRGRHVHDRIAMMDEVVAPENRDLVHRHVGDIEGQIQDEDGGRQLHEWYLRKDVQDAKAMARKGREGQDEAGVHQDVGRESDERECEVGTKVPAVCSFAEMQGDDRFDQSHDDHRKHDRADRDAGLRK